jgi:hypothetical protein
MPNYLDPRKYLDFGEYLGQVDCEIRAQTGGGYSIYDVDSYDLVVHQYFREDVSPKDTATRLVEDLLFVINPQKF